MVPLDQLMKRVQVAAPPRRREIRAPPIPEPAKPKPLGREYVAIYQEQEIEKYKRASRIDAEPGDDVRDNRSHCNLSEVDTMTVGTMSVRNADDETSRIYEQYEFDEPRKELRKLEVYPSKTEILNKIEIHNVVIIKGATGCGKSTQVPQFILEDAREKKVYCNIIVTQPRRIAATTVARRVAKERRCGLGTLVGYQIGLDKKANDDTRILYVTTGVLLQKLIQQKQMKEYTHYIIDEIHERDQDMDFVLYMIRYFLNTNSKETRLILMSATIDTAKFHDYLITYYGEKPFKPAIVQIGHKTPYRVVQFYLDDLRTGKNKIHEVVGLSHFDINKPEIQPNAYRAAARIILNLDVVESQNDASESSEHHRGGAVLVFLPGLYEIQTMELTLREICRPEQLKKLWIKPLHSTITSDEQNEVFRSPPDPSMRKIILSTNIAESSVTVPDIEYVIDFCLTKIQVSDPFSNFTSLEMAWASHNNLIQRAGRVGRVREGRCYRIIPRAFCENDLVREAVPEILRCSLETLVLKAKLLDMDPPKQVLALTMDQPNLENIHQAVARLKQMGALLVRVNDVYDPCDGDLTWLGEVVANLPIDVRLGKLIFLGCMLGIPEDCILMACAMSNKNLFSSPYNRELDSYNQKLFWANSSCSDCLAFLNAYKAYRTCLHSGKAAKSWASDNFLQLQVLKEIGVMQEEIKRRLSSLNLYSHQIQRPEEMEELENGYHSFFLKMAIAGAFYPNYFGKGSSQAFDEKGMYAELDEHDPYSTVYLQGLPSGRMNKAYKGIIKKQFERITDRLDVHVTNISAKAYVTFRRPLGEFGQGKIPGKINMLVYQALKMAQLQRFKVTVPYIRSQDLNVILHDYEQQKVKAYQKQNWDDKSFNAIVEKLIWPWRQTELVYASKILELQVSHVESPDRFWIQSTLRNSVDMLRDMMSALNNDWDDGDMALLKPPSSKLTIDGIYVAQHDRAFRRCRILGKGFDRNTYAVHFIDFGFSNNKMHVDQIYDMSPVMKRELFYDKLPDFAQECALVKIRPNSEKLALESVWHSKAINILRSLVNMKTVAKVYSMVNNVLRIKLVHPSYKDRKYHRENTVNFKLISSGLAQPTEEEYPSVFFRKQLKYVHSVKTQIEERRKEDKLKEDERRTNVGETINEEKESLAIISRISYDDLELPDNPNNQSEINLRGPYSPLEIKLASVTKDAAGKQVVIERVSVNSVLLDSDPADPKDKMLVAAYIGTNPARDKLMLRHTTLMPNFPALPMLCCLTFSPMVEMKINVAKTKYCGAICGLGYDRETRESLYPVDDIAVVFDHEIGHNVLELVNKIRLHLSNTMNASVRDRNSKDFFVNGSKYFRERLVKLFVENEYPLTESEYPQDRFRWGGLRTESMLNPVMPSKKQREEGIQVSMPHPADDCDLIYRLIWGVALKGDREKEMEILVHNLKKLNEFTRANSRNGIECYLCKMQLDGSANANLHLKTKIHRLRLKNYLRQPKTEEQN